MVTVRFILGSTREGRNGEKVWEWVKGEVAKRSDFASAWTDLRDKDFPFLHEAETPSSGKYTDPKTVAWAKEIAASDAFVVVHPEYNHGYPAVLKNAFDLVYPEWNNKPIAFVSYGGVGGGLRAAEQLRQVAVELQMAPIREQVGIPRVWAAFEESGALIGREHFDKALHKTLDQLAWWAEALKTAREKTA